jgi:hypothetical protein
MAQKGKDLSEWGILFGIFSLTRSTCAILKDDHFVGGAAGPEHAGDDGQKVL